MKTREAQNWDRRLISRVTRAAATAVILLGMTVLIEWGLRRLNIARISERFIPVAPLTAMTVILLGCGLLVGREAGRLGLWRRFRRMAILLPFILATAILLQFIGNTLFGSALDMEGLLIPESILAIARQYGRMSPVTAILMILCATSMLAPRAGYRSRRYSDYPAIASGIMAAVILIGYLFNAPLFYGGTVTPVALPTAVAFLLIALAILLDGPDAALSILLTSETVTAMFVRTIVPSSIAIILAEQWIEIVLINKSDVFTHDITYVVMSMLIVGVLMSLLIWLIARRIDHAVITKQKLLAAIQRQQQAILDNIPDLAWLKDKESRYIAVNEPFARSCGRKKSELPGLTDFDLWSNDLAERYRSDDRDVMESRHRKRVEEPMESSGGLRGVVDTIKTPIMTEAGDIIGTCGIARDVTDQKKMELQLRDSEEKLRTVIDSAQDAVVMIDHVGLVTLWNAAAESISGYRSDEAMGRNISAFIVSSGLKEGHDAAFPNWKKIGDGAAIGTTVELRAKRKNGVEFPIEMSLGGVQVAGQRHLVTIIRDITTRQLIKQEMNLLNVAMKQSPASVVITDLEGAIQYVNPKFEQVTGYTAGEVLGKNPRLLKSGKSSIEIYRDLWESITSGRTWSGEFYNRRKDGKLFWERASISPIRDHSGVITGFVAVKEDITARKEMETQLAQSRKMESIGQLAGGVAHDFNNLLTVISGTVEEMRRLPGAASSAEYLDEMDTAAHRAADLTHQLLAFGRRQVFSSRIMDLNAAIRQQKKLLRRVIREDISIVLKLAPDLLRVRSDYGQVLQILMNLAANARDAMPDGGRLEIATANFDYANETVYHSSPLPPGRYVLLTIADTGTGMTPEMCERIFEPFFTTKGKEEGTGLGLATVHGIVAQSSGRIWVESEPGKGTTFGIVLPGLEELPDVLTESTAANSARRAHGEVVLVVDDEVGILKIVKRALERHGYSVITARDGEEALVTTATLERLDLLVTDIVMPRLGGLDMASRLLETRPNLPVLYISGHIDQLDKAQGRLNDTNFMAKPFSIKDLLTRVGVLLDGKKEHDG